MTINKFLVLVFSIFICSTINIDAAEKIPIDIKYYDSGNCGSAYYLCENGDLFVSGIKGYDYFGDIDFMNLYSIDTTNTNIYRLATGVKKIFYNDSVLFVIKNDNSLWVRGYNIYSVTPMKNKYWWELTKIDDDVEEVYASCTSDFYPHYWLYKKTDNSLWTVGSHSALNLNSVNSNIPATTPVYVTDNVKEATNNRDNIYILKNDSSLYTSINGNLNKITDGIKKIKANVPEGYVHSYEYVLTSDNKLYIFNENSKNLTDGNLIAYDVDKFDVYAISDETILYTIKSNTLYEEKFILDQEHFKISDLEEKKIFDNVTEIYSDSSYCSFLTENNELYTIKYATEVSDYKIEKRDGIYTKLFNFNYALNSEGKGIAIFSSQNSGLNLGLDSNDFDFNNSIEYVDRTYSTWAENEVNNAINNDIVPSFLQMKYKDNITREEFCKLVIKMLTTKLNTSIDKYISDENIIINENRFTDTTDENILLTEKLGIVNGYENNLFKPDSNITRQEAAVILNNLSKYMNITVNNNKNLFSDDNKIGAWAKSSVYNINSISDKNGNFVMSGVGNNNFNPQGFYTREQAILTVYRLYNSWENTSQIRLIWEVFF